MSRKNVLVPKLPLAAAQSMAANFATPATCLSFLDNASYQILVTAAGSSGQFYLDGSDDYPSNGELENFVPTNWVEIMPCGTVSGANDQILIDVNQWPHNYARLRYVSATPGAGSCTIRLTAKQLGG